MVILSQGTCMLCKVNCVSGFVAFISNYAPIPASPMPLLPVQSVGKQDVRHRVLLPKAQEIEIYQQKFWPSDLLH